MTASASQPELREARDGDSWERDLAELLADLSAVQSDLLDMLQQKRHLLVQSDTAGLAAVAPREQELISRLEACQQCRARLLQRADAEGLPAASLTALAEALPAGRRSAVEEQVGAARARFRLLHHQSLTSWVLVQRNLIHLSQMLEIIATGGRPEPTYNKGSAPQARGALVDQAV